jgi:hypothetical protein
MTFEFNTGNSNILIRDEVDGSIEVGVEYLGWNS